MVWVERGGGEIGRVLRMMVFFLLTSLMKLNSPIPRA